MSFPNFRPVLVKVALQSYCDSPTVREETGRVAHVLIGFRYLLNVPCAQKSSIKSTHLAFYGCPLHWFSP